MALTRKWLRAQGIDDEKIDLIIEAHTETVDALKTERDDYKAAADKLTGVQKELDDLKASSSGNDDYKAKYDKEHADFEAYKADAAAKESRAEVERLYRAELSALGITGKRADQVIRVTDLSGVTAKDGKLADAESIQKTIREDWADFIPAKHVKGQIVPTPPKNDGGKMTRDEIRKITDPTERRAAIAANLDQFE